MAKLKENPEFDEVLFILNFIRNLQKIKKRIGKLSNGGITNVL